MAKEKHHLKLTAKGIIILVVFVIALLIGTYFFTGYMLTNSHACVGGLGGCQGGGGYGGNSGQSQESWENRHANDPVRLRPTSRPRRPVTPTPKP